MWPFLSYPVISNLFTYRSPATTGTSETKEKGSKFFGFVYPVSNEEDIKRYLDELKERYPDATHHCYAWVLGIKAELFRANDDGEPGNSAGKPIYRQIISNDLTNTLVVVVRYYGGTKLGVPGLIRAYGEAAKEAIDSVEILEKEISVTARIDGPSGEEHLVFVTANRLGIPVDVIAMTDRFSLRCTIPKSKLESFMEAGNLWHKFEIKLAE